MFHCRLGEGCTHISGLLFALEANSTKQRETPCTSKPCSWNKGGKRKKDSQEVSDIQLKKLKYGSKPCEPSNKKHIALPQTAAQDFFVSLTSNSVLQSHVLYYLAYYQMKVIITMISMMI